MRGGGFPKKAGGNKMSNDLQDGGLNGGLNAFPDEENYRLTKREYFAGLAMQGMISIYAEKFFFGDLARDSVHAADELLEKLQETK
jgi:hypothetical protein